MSKEIKQIVLFALEVIAPQREDLIRAVRENIPHHQPKVERVNSANSRAENITHLYFSLPRTGSLRSVRESELRTLILGQYLPLQSPDCASLTRLLEISDQVEGISLRFVKGEITEQEYKDLLAGK